MKTFATTTALAIAALCLLGARGSACSCIQPGPPAAAIEDADRVFAGEVESIKSAGDQAVEVRLRVVRWFKGDTGRETIVVRTARHSASCGYPFESGSAYFVYAYESDESAGSPQVSLCSRTAELGSATEDLAEVNAEDLLDYVPRGDGGGCGGATNLGMIQAAAFSLLTLSVLRRRKKA